MAFDARTRVAVELTLFCRYFYDFHPSGAFVVHVPLKHLVEINHVAAVRTLLAIDIVCTSRTFPVPHKLDFPAAIISLLENWIAQLQWHHPVNTSLRTPLDENSLLRHASG